MCAGIKVASENLKPVRSFLIQNLGVVIVAPWEKRWEGLWFLRSVYVSLTLIVFIYYFFLFFGDVFLLVAILEAFMHGWQFLRSDFILFCIVVLAGDWLLCHYCQIILAVLNQIALSFWNYYPNSLRLPPYCDLRVSDKISVESNSFFSPLWQ